MRAVAALTCFFRHGGCGGMGGGARPSFWGEKDRWGRYERARCRGHTCSSAVAGTYIIYGEVEPLYVSADAAAPYRICPCGVYGTHSPDDILGMMVSSMGKAWARGVVGGRSAAMVTSGISCMCLCRWDAPAAGALL